MKLDLVGGRINTDKLADIISLLDTNNTIEITTRQDLNIRFIKDEQKKGRVSVLVDIFDDLVDDNILPSFHIAKEIKQLFLNNFSKKINIAISGNRLNRCALFHNEVCYALSKKGNLFGYNLYLYGTTKQEAKPANIFLRNKQEVLLVATSIKKILETFNTKRFYRLEEKINIKEMAELIKKFSKNNFQSAGEIIIQKDYYKEDNIISLKHNLYAIKYTIPAGILNTKTIQNIIKLSKNFGNNELRIDKEQNIFIMGVKSKDINQFDFAKSTYYDHQIACSGERFCKYGLIDSKLLSIELNKYLEDIAIPPKSKISFYWSGCSRGCAGHLLGDIGFQGVRKNLKTGIKIFVLGKEVVSFATFGEVKKFVSTLLKEYKQNQAKYQTFRDFLLLYNNF